MGCCGGRSDPRGDGGAPHHLADLACAGRSTTPKSAPPTSPPTRWTGKRSLPLSVDADGAPAPNLHIAEEISGNCFRIAGGRAGNESSWQRRVCQALSLHQAASTVHRSTVRPDNIALVTASLLPFRTEWQAIANGLPGGGILIVLPWRAKQQRIGRRVASQPPT
jgi:hypothetical protein